MVSSGHGHQLDKKGRERAEQQIEKGIEDAKLEKRLRHGVVERVVDGHAHGYQQRQLMLSSELTLARSVGATDPVHPTVKRQVQLLYDLPNLKTCIRFHLPLPPNIPNALVKPLTTWRDLYGAKMAIRKEEKTVQDFADSSVYPALQAWEQKREDAKAAKVLFLAGKEIPSEYENLIKVWKKKQEDKKLFLQAWLQTHPPQGLKGEDLSLISNSDAVSRCTIIWQNIATSYGCISIDQLVLDKGHMVTVNKSTADDDREPYQCLISAPGGYGYFAFCSRISGNYESVDKERAQELMEIAHQEELSINIDAALIERTGQALVAHLPQQNRGFRWLGAGGASGDLIDDHRVNFCVSKKPMKDIRLEWVGRKMATKNNPSGKK